MLKFLIGQQVIEYAKKLQEKGAQNVLVSMGSEGAILLDKNGYSYTMKLSSKQQRINTVGAGDSMVAGFIAGCQLFHNYEKAFQMGIAAATSTANSIFLATKDDIYKLFNLNNL